MSRKTVAPEQLEDGSFPIAAPVEAKKSKPKRKRVAETSDQVWLTKAETAKMVGMSVKTFNQNINDFKGVRTMKVGNRTAYFKQSVQTWLDEAAKNQ